MQGNQLILFSDKNELLTKAQEEADKADEIFKESTKLYFIARYFVSVYESRNYEIPIQVWNEYRNALDHYFRWQTAKNNASVEENPNSHIKKLERHLLRACLDVLKIFIHETLQTSHDWRDQYPKRVYHLVDNGQFYTDLVKSENNIGRAFEKGKMLDAGLGDDPVENGKVLDQYLETAFMADSLLFTLIYRQPDFIKAEASFNSIFKAAHNLSFVEHFKVHFWFYVAWSLIIVGGGGYLKDNYWTQTKSFIAESVFADTAETEKE